MRKKTICLVPSDNTFVWPGSDPKSIYSSPIPSFSLWVKKTGQEFLALEVCLVTQRTRKGPCVAFNSLHCLPKANLGQAQSLTAHRLWTDEWKVKYAFKCKTEDWPGIVVLSLWECEIFCWPRQQEERGQLQLRSWIQAHVCRWWAVIHWLCTTFHVAPCVKNKWMVTSYCSQSALNHQTELVAYCTSYMKCT